MALWLSLSCGFSLFLFFCLFIITKAAPKTQLKERIERLRHPAAFAEQAAAVDGEPLPRPFAERIIMPFFQQLEQQVGRLAPARISMVLADKMMRAGKQHRWNVNAFVCCWLLLSVSLSAASIFFAFYGKQMAFLQGLALMICALVLGAVLPVAFLDSFIARRQKAILRQLPEVLDLLCVSVQAGLSFDGAMTKVTDKMQGPLIEECSKLLRDSRMGMPRRLALTKLAERCHLQEVYLFTAAVIQSDRLGVSMAKTLVAQAENMRERRRQTIKEQALKAPVKMLFPLAAFIFPVLFIVVLFPLAVSILNNIQAMSK